jgi:hypothetical protein
LDRVAASAFSVLTTTLLELLLGSFTVVELWEELGNRNAEYNLLTTYRAQASIHLVSHLH